MLEAVKNGATFKPAVVTPGQLYWKLVKAEGPVEWGGRHSIYVDCINLQGYRDVGVPVTYSWGDESQTKPTEAKPGEPFALDFPMFNARPALSVWVDDLIPSDELHGMGLVPNEPHVVYKLIFQETRAESAPVTPPAPTPPGNKGSIKLYLDGELVYER